MNDSDDDTIRIPVIVGSTDPYRGERVLFIWLCVAYMAAGAVLSFACWQLADVAHQINAAPYCRRL